MMDSPPRHRDEHELAIPTIPALELQHLEPPSYARAKDDAEPSTSEHGTLLPQKPHLITPGHDDDHEDTNEVAGFLNVDPPHSRNSSQVNLFPSKAATYSLERYIARSVLNTLGPCLFTAFYLFIVFVYLLRPSVNGVIPYFPIPAQGVFFALFVVSIFVFDWARSGIAGFEAAALMKPRLAPKNALQFMWHADRAWGSPSGWYKALVAVYEDIRHRSTKERRHKSSQAPGALWWYLSLSSFLLYVAVPFAGLSMDPKEALKLSTRKILISGTNETTFDTRNPNALAETANGRWRQGNPTTPQGETIFYAPQGTSNVSATYYEDVIQKIYRNDTDSKSDSGASVTFFSGPQVSERAHGRAWGLHTNLNCSIANPYNDLHLLKVKAINNWTSTAWGVGSDAYMNGSTFDVGTIQLEQFFSGLTPVLWYPGVNPSYGVSYQYLITTDRDIEGGSDYTNASAFPMNGALEIVMWQSYQAPFSPDAIFANLSTHPAVVSSTSTYDNNTYLGYAVRCAVSSTVGFAALDGPARTFSNYTVTAAAPSVVGFGDGVLVTSPGVLALQSIVYGAFTTAILEYGAAPVCEPGQSASCSPFYGANVATGGTPALVTDTIQAAEKNLQYPTITPERMKLAMYKLFGEAAIAMMALGPGDWVGELEGHDAASDLDPGMVPWQLVLLLLVAWTLITVLPNVWTFAERRWADSLDGFGMWRFGAEWREAVWRLDETEFRKCAPVLRGLPGMVGDMEAGKADGFVGLSHFPIGQRNLKARRFVHDRDVLADGLPTLGK
jgi:hypothetical protein